MNTKFLRDSSAVMKIWAKIHLADSVDIEVVNTFCTIVELAISELESLQESNTQNEAAARLWKANAEDLREELGKALNKARHAGNIAPRADEQQELNSFLNRHPCGKVPHLVMCDDKGRFRNSDVRAHWYGWQIRAGLEAHYPLDQKPE